MENMFFFFLQKELHFDDEHVLQQIKYTGIRQMVHIQKSGYSAKYTFEVGTSVFYQMCWILEKLTIINIQYESKYCVPVLPVAENSRASRNNLIEARF